jgi:hypothetical protein
MRGPFVRLERHAINTADCALAVLVPQERQAEPADQYAERYQPLKSETPAAPCCDMKVVKVGAVTGPTDGTIVDVDAELYVDYSFGTFRFQKQVVIDGGPDCEFARSGDSGSLVVETENGQAVAMIFAASGRYAVACPIDEVLKQLGVELVA